MRLAILVLALAAIARTARAQPYDVPASAVFWRAPAECGDGGELRRRIAGYLDHAIGAGLLAAVEVTHGDGDDAMYVAHLRIRAGDGVAERTVEARDCAQVVDAVALVLSLAAAQPTSTVGPLPPDDDDGIDRRTGVAPRSRLVSLRVRGAGDLGAIPGGGVGVDAGLAFTRGRYAVVVSAAWFPSRYASLGTTGRAGVDVSLTEVAAEGCVRVGGAWLCLGGAGGVMTGRGVDVPPARTRTSPWAAITAGVVLEERISDRARFVGELQGLGAVLRTRFTLDDGSVLYEPALIGGRLLAGFEISLF